MGEKEFKDKLNEYKERNDYNFEYGNMLLFGLKFNYIDIKFFLNEIDCLIKNNVSVAEYLYNCIKGNEFFKEYDVELEYLKNRINEENLYNLLSPVNKNIYNSCLENGQIASSTEDFEAALNYYIKGKNFTKHPIFDYYIGQTYFSLHKFEPSLGYFSSYNEVAGEKIMHTLLYLCSLLVNKKNIDENKIFKEDIENRVEKLFHCYDKFNEWKFLKYSKTRCPLSKKKLRKLFK